MAGWWRGAILREFFACLRHSSSHCFIFPWITRLNNTTMAEIGAEVAAAFKRVSTSLADGQSHIDALVVFLRERAALEDNYSKALSKLSKAPLALDGELRGRGGSSKHSSADARARPLKSAKWSRRRRHGFRCRTLAR
jgi:hypothetical protein